MTTYEVKMGVPICGRKYGGPPPKSDMRVALESMPVGGMIEVKNTRAANNLITLTAKGAQLTFVRRKLADGKLGIWRTA